MAWDLQGNIKGPQGEGGSAGSSELDWVNVKKYGAVGNGVADDTAAVASAVAAAAGKPVYFPTGDYKVTAWPAIVDNMTFVGSSARNSTIVFGGTGTLISAVTKQNVHFTNLGFFATGATSKLLDLSNCFVWTFTGCLFRGNHTSASGATYRGQYGITLRDNTGGCRFVDCDINNLGYGVRVSCIQNHFTMCKFVSNWYAILGTGNNSAAGLNITMTEFDAPKDGTTTAAHIWIDGMANEWNITQTWFEGGNKSLIVGLAGTGGPSKFYMAGCKMAAQTVALELNHCRQPHLVNTEFDADQNSIPGYKEMLIDSTHCVEGVADNLITTVRDDFSFDDFPPYWNVIRKGQQRAGEFKANGVEVEGATRTGDFFMEYNAAVGKIMATDADGKAYWRTPAELGLGGGGGGSQIEVVTTLPTTGTPGVLYVTTVT